MFLGLLVLILLLWGFLQTNAGQNWLVRQVTGRLSRDLQTRISINHVSLDLFSFNKMDLDGVLVEDRKKDTLLYAGTVQVRITDWFLFKDKAELKYIGLENATIHINRTDSVWNYAFLEDYFASGPDTTGKKAGIEFDLKTVALRNVNFIKRDAWLGSDMAVRVGALDLDARKLTLTGKTIQVNSLVLDRPDVALFSYPGKYVAPSTKKAAAAPAAPPAWDIRFGNVTIRNGRFRTDRDTLGSRVSTFDGQHLDFSAISANVRNVGFAADTLRGEIELSARERSGLVVKSLKAKTTVHPQAMIFDALRLETNRSVIGPYLAFRYKNINALSDFIHSVTVDSRFRQSRISSDDIAFFAPALKTWKREIRISGTVRGTVDDFEAPDLELAAGDNTYLRGDLKMQGLPDINTARIELRSGDLRTTYADAADLVPDLRRLRRPDLRQLQYVRYTGDFAGTVRDFRTDGTIATALGSIAANMDMRLPAGGIPTYSGRLATPGFRLGTLLNNRDLGIVEFTGSVSGAGFNWPGLQATVKGNVRRFQFRDYTYRNITLNESVKNGSINGQLAVRDPNLRISLDGRIDLSGPKPYFSIRTGRIDTANLLALGFTKQNIRLKGDFGLDAYASSLSDLVGNATIGNMVIYNEDKSLPLEGLTITAKNENGVRVLTVASPLLNADIRGQFDINRIPDAVLSVLHRYYPSYFKAPGRAVPPMAFTFDINTPGLDDYLQLLEPRISAFELDSLRGSLDTRTGTIAITGRVPVFGYKQYLFNGLDFNLSASANDSLRFTSVVDNISVSDSLQFPETSISIRALDSISRVTVYTKSNRAINQANLSAQIRLFEEGAAIRFDSSAITLNGKTWQVRQEGSEINLGRNTPVEGKLVLQESSQVIEIQTEIGRRSSSNDLHVRLQNINLGDIAPFVLPKNRLEGLLSGHILVEDPLRNFYIDADTVRISELRFDQDSIGDVEARVAYDNATGIITGSGNNLDPVHRIEFDLGLDLKDSANTYQDRINTRLTRFELKYLNRFLGTLFSDIQGFATGNFSILGEGRDRDYVAKARLDSASFKVNFTQVSYRIDDTEIELRPDTIDLDGIRIRDERGNVASVKGYISHQAFANMFYDIALNTESKQMLLLNTNYSQNQQFYGRAWGSGSFVLVGPQSDLLMDVRIKASEDSASTVTLPPSNARQTGLAPFMVERKYGREMTPAGGGVANNLNFDVRLTANPKVDVRVILDELTGDMIQARGSGDLRITSGTTEPLQLNGRFNIQSGQYEFTFQAFLKRPFVLRNTGNNFIEWTGDPYKAQMHIDAEYTTQSKVSFAPLASNSAFSNLRLVNERDFVTIYTTLTGDLFSPAFKFQLFFDPARNRIYSNPQFALAIQQIENNLNELNKQVTYLIVFNSFAPLDNANAGVAGFDPFGELTYSTISGLLFGKVNQELNRVLSKVLKNNRATFNVTGSIYNRTVFDQSSRGSFRLPNQTDFGATLGLPLLNGRGQLIIGGTLGVPLTSNSINQSVRLLPDVTLELQVNQSGSVRATFFFRQNVDQLTGAVGNTGTPTRYGASIGYGKGFNNLRELFGGKRRREDVRPPRIEAVKPEEGGADSTTTVRKEGN